MKKNIFVIFFYELATFRGALLENPKSFYKNQGLKTSYGALKTGLDLEKHCTVGQTLYRFCLASLYGFGVGLGNLRYPGCEMTVEIVKFLRVKL